MFLIAIFVIFAMLAQCNFENKDGKDLKFFKATLINLSRETEVSIVGKIFEFKGYLLYYIDQKRQIIVFLNLDKTMTIKFGYNSYQVDPNTNASCVPGSLNEYRFVLNRTHILFQCNGLTRAVVRARSGIDEKYPFPSFTNYSALIYLFNNEQCINYNNKMIYPSPDQPNVTLEKFSVNGVPMINSSESNREQSKSSSNAEEMITQSNYSTIKTIVNSSVFDMEKNKTDSSQTYWWWLVLIIPFAIFIPFGVYRYGPKVMAYLRSENVCRSESSPVPSQTINKNEEQPCLDKQLGNLNYSPSGRTDEMITLVGIHRLEENPFS